MDVPEVNSFQITYLFFEDAWDKCERVGTRFIPPGQLDKDFDCVTYKKV